MTGAVRSGRQVRHVLFITSNRLGDAVLSTGLLAHVLHRHPGAAVTVACGPLPAPLFAPVPGVVRVIPLAKRRYAAHWLDLWRTCVGTRWDLVIDLRNSAVSRLVVCRRRAVLPRGLRDVHRVVRIAATLGVSEPPAPRLWHAPGDMTEAGRLVPDGAPVLAVAPVANWIGKTWPAERFATLIERLTGPDGILPGARVAVLAATAERGAATPVVQSVPSARRLDLIGRGTPALAAACLTRCRFFIGNDSGLMHLAAATGVPTLGLFGPSSITHYGPWGCRTAVASTPECLEQMRQSPGFSFQANHSYMTGLDVETVEAAAGALWQRLPVVEQPTGILA